jgi:hypothetical protein
MYLSRAGRVACTFCAVLFFLWLAVSILVVATGNREADDLVALAGMAVLIGLPLGIPTVMLGRYLFSDARRLVEQHDVFRGTLGLPQVAERGGVQWALLAFPDAVRVPAVAVVAVLLQNCHARPRRVAVHVNPSDLPGLARDGAVVLKPGEAGLLRFPIPLGPEVPERPLWVAVEVSASAPDGPGPRVIRADGASPRSAPHYRGVTIDVTGAHGGPPLHEEARRWTGWQPLFVTGMRAADLEPLRLLESLTGTPS